MQVVVIELKTFLLDGEIFFIAYCIGSLERLYI